MPRFEIPDVRGETRDMAIPASDGTVTQLQDQVTSLTTALAAAQADATTAKVDAAAAKTQAATVASTMPKPATDAPPPVQVDSSKGTTSGRFAMEDHTHQSRLQARRIQVTPNAAGQAIYTFPLAYDAGVIPVLSTTAETPNGAAYRNDASIVQGTTTNTQTTILVTRLNQNVVVGLLNAVLPVFAPVTTATWVNIMSRAPS